MSDPKRLSFGLGAPLRPGESVEPTGVLRDLAPKTPLARAQLHWPAVAGEAVARVSRPVTERDGVITVACSTAAWAQELDLMQTQLLAALRSAGLGEVVKGLRFTADLPRHS